jgi:diguanylate cyclase (GGDEF)-like protein/PAS domain S-box-containing protein
VPYSQNHPAENEDVARSTHSAVVSQPDLDPMLGEMLARPEALHWATSALVGAPLPIALRDSELRLVWANEAYESFTGRRLSQLRGSNISDVLQTVEKTRLETVETGLIDPRQPMAPQKNIRYERPDGTSVFADATFHPLRSADGEVIFLLGYLEDVTDRFDLDKQRLLDDLVASTSARFIDVTPASVAEATRAALQSIGEQFGCRLVSLTEKPHAAATLRRHELWSDLPLEDEAQTMQRLVDIGATIDRWTVMHDPDMGSLALVPVARTGQSPDVLALSASSDRTWSDREAQTLGAISSLLAGLYARIEAQIYLDVAFDDAPVGISVRSNDSTLLAANQAYADFLGYDSPAEMIGVASTGVVSNSDASVADNIPRTVDELGTFTVDRMEFTRKDGSTALGRVNAKRVGGLSKDELLILSHVEDLTSADHREKALEASQQRFRDLVENSPAITMMIDEALNITYASPSVTKVGWTRHELVGTNVDNLPPEAANQLAMEVRRVMASGRPRHFDWAPRGHEGAHWLRVAAVPQTNDANENDGVIMVAVDDSARRATQAQLLHQAHHDPLTGLANRTALNDHLEQMLSWQDAERPAVIFLDVDRFKVVNDSLGHGVGDKLIKQVAERLVQSVRSGNMVARFGGDEFVIVVDGPIDVEQALGVSERIRASLVPPFTIDEHELYVSVSMGIAFLDSDDVELAISRADAAMYQAKEAGRNRAAVFSPDVEYLPGERIRTEAELRRALLNNQLEPFFQAEVDLATGALLGGEALVRWFHPDRGLLAAGEFISIAEDCGVISEIGDFVMHEACTVLHEWQSNPATAGLTVRVNLSAHQLTERDIVDRVVAALEATGADPAGLCLEITESVLMADAEASLKVLQELRDLGPTLAVDDFGTGYSSLSYLKLFPVDILKIDRSFVDGLPTDSNDIAIVKSIISLANALGLDLVAEGVETIEQGKSLLGMGCTRAQGYYYGRPMPRSDFEASDLFQQMTRAKTR